MTTSVDLDRLLGAESLQARVLATAAGDGGVRPWDLLRWSSAEIRALGELVEAGLVIIDPKGKHLVSDAGHRECDRRGLV